MIGRKIELVEHYDERGILIAINHIPFEAKRVFFISDVPDGAIRGNHFSKTSCFLYTLIHGSCKVSLDNGFTKEDYKLTAGEGLFLPKETWIEIHCFQKDTVLCVLADTEYSAADYVTDYNEFCRIVRMKNV